MGIFIALAVLGYCIARKSDFVASRPAPTAHALTTDFTYYDIPRLNVVVGSGNTATHVRIDLSLEVGKDDLSVIEGYQPRITARLNRFLMTINPDRMQKANWLPWLRSQMLGQINRAGAPVPVHNVLFRQLVVM